MWETMSVASNTVHNSQLNIATQQGSITPYNGANWLPGLFLSSHMLLALSTYT